MRLNWVTYTVFGAFAVCMAFMLGCPVGFVADDSYFYLVVADNVAAGRGVTFNGVFTTNGVQPLWTALLVPIAAATDAAASYLRAVVVLHASLVAVGFWWLLDAGRRLELEAPIRPALLVPPLGVLGALGVLGSEAALNFAAISAVIWLLTRHDDTSDSFWPAILFGVALASAMLARLDNVFLAGAAVGCWTYRRRVSTGLVAVAAASLLVAPYLAANFWFFGHLTPITGVVKSTFPEVGPYLESATYVQLAALLVAVAGTVVVVSTSDREPLRSVSVTLTVGALLQTSYYALFQPYPTKYWYAVLPAVAAGFAFAAAVDALGRRFESTDAPTTLAGAGIAVAVLGIPLYAYVDEIRPGPPAAVEMARDLDAKLPAPRTLFTADRPGVLQFFGRGTVLEPEARTTNWQFHERIADVGTRQFFCEQSVDYIWWERSDGAIRGECLERRTGTDTCGRWRLTPRSSLLDWESFGSIVVGADDVAARYPPLEDPGDIVVVFAYPREKYCRD